MKYPLRVGQNGAFIVGESDGDVLIWDAASSLWKPGTASGQIPPLSRVSYVDADLASPAPDGSIAAPYRTIQAALDAMPPPTSSSQAETAWLILIVPSVNLYGEDVVLPSNRSTILQAAPSDGRPDLAVVLNSLTWHTGGNHTPTSGLVGIAASAVTITAPDGSTSTFALVDSSVSTLSLASDQPSILVNNSEVDSLTTTGAVAVEDSYVGTVAANNVSLLDSGAGDITLSGESPSIVAQNTSIDAIIAPAGCYVSLDGVSSSSFLSNVLDPSINPTPLDWLALQYREAVVTVESSATPVDLGATPQVSLLVVQGTAAQAVTLPQAGTMSPTTGAVPRFSRVFTVVNQSTLDVTISPADGDSIDGGDVTLTTGQIQKFAVRADTAWLPF